MNNFEIKEFYGTETLRYKKLCSLLFRAPNPELLYEELYEKKLEEQDADKKADFIRLGAFLDGRLYAALEMIPYKIYLDGKISNMYGIGGVISDPEAPKKGAVKELFTEGFKIMREKQYFISHLYPFEMNYYRQYGYDVSCEYAEWNIPITHIPSFKEGSIKAFDNSPKMQQDIIDIYNKFAITKNMAISRTEVEWKNFFEKHRAYTTDYLSYLHYTDSDADAYMCFTPKTHPEKPMTLKTDNLWFSSFEGLRGILSFFPTQKAYAADVLIKLPTDIDLSAIIESCSGWGKKNSSRTIHSCGTSKIIDVQKILEQLKYKDSGEITIKISDDIYCPWNNDCFNVKFGDDTVVSRGGTPDIEMNIKSFSSTILGRYDIHSCTVFPDVKIYNNNKDLEKVFYRKNCWIEEHF